MKIQTESLQQLNTQIGQIIEKTQQLEIKYLAEISNVHPLYRRSAKNLLHYLAFRSFEIDIMQDKLRELGLPSLTNIEGHVMESLLSIKTVINHLLGEQKIEHRKGVIASEKSRKILNKNTKMLFGYKSKRDEHGSW